MDLSEFLGSYQEARHKKEAAAEKLKKAMEEYDNAMFELDSTFGLLDDFLLRLDVDALTQTLLDKDTGMPGVMKSLFTGNFGDLF